MRTINLIKAIGITLLIYVIIGYILAVYNAIVSMNPYPGLGTFLFILSILVTLCSYLILQKFNGEMTVTQIDKEDEDPDEIGGA